MSCGQARMAEQEEEAARDREEHARTLDGKRFFKMGELRCGQYLQEMMDIVDRMVDRNAPRLKAEHDDLEILEEMLTPYTR